jgi:Ca-activated chloride channel family protein
MSRFIAPFLLVLFLSTVSQTLAQSSDRPARPPVLKSGGTYRGESKSPRTSGTESTISQSNPSTASASLVTVPAVVMDRNGRYVANLKRDDFRIYEDGVEQQISFFNSIEKPFTVALMLDVSGSTQYQLAQIREAANTFVGRLRSNDRLMVITFDGQIHLLVEPTSVATIRQTKIHIPAVTDGTALYDAVDFATKKVAAIPGRKAIVLMTDGVDQSSKSATLQSTIDAMTEQDALVYTVQYNTLPQLPQRLSAIKNEKARRKIQERLLRGYAASEPYLRALADKTGGRFYKADDLRDVAPAFEAITAELGVQYTLGYFPKENSASGERAIKVRVRYPNLVVRARDSYTTSPTLASKE